MVGRYTIIQNLMAKYELLIIPTITLNNHKINLTLRQCQMMLQKIHITANNVRITCQNFKL